MEKYLNPKKNNNLFTENLFNIRIFDLYRTGDAQKLSLGIRAAIESLLNGVIVPRDVFIAGEFSNVGKIKKDKISEKWVKVAVKNGASKIQVISGRVPSSLGTDTVAGIPVEYCKEFECLSKAKLSGNDMA